MAKPNLPPGISGGTTKAPEKNIWEPNDGEILVGKMDKVEGSNFSDLAVFPAAFLFSSGWRYLAGPKFLKLPISRMIEGLISPGQSGQYFVVEFDTLGVARGNQSAPKLFKAVTTFAPKSEEEKQIREFLHRAHTDALNANDATKHKLADDDPQSPLSDNDDGLPF